MSLELDLTSKRTKNLKVLKSINENVFEIVEDSSHVALYRYDTILSKWMKLDVEGTAFITRNKEAPFYSLIVMNKKGPTDFVLDLDASLKVKVQDVYIMMKCSTNNVSFVFGLWFHHVDERTSIFQAMKRITSNTNGNSPTGLNSTLSSLLQSSSQKGKSPPASARGSESDENVQKLSFSDILKGKSREISPVHSKPPTDSGVSNGSMSGCESSSASKKNLLLSALRPSTDNLANSPVPSSVVFSSATTPEATISNGSSDTPSGANRLLSLLKASGRDPATAAVTSGSSSSGSTGNTPSIETKNGANGSTSQSNNHPANPSAKKPSNLLPSPMTSGMKSGKNIPSPPVPEDERSVKLLSMLRVATTSDQAMDLLTDGDIANKVNKSHTTAATSSATTSASAAHASTASLSTLQSAVSAASPGILGSSSDRLLSLLKTNSSSTVNGSGSSNSSMANEQQQVSNHQQMTRAHTVGSVSNSTSVSAKEDKLRSMLSMSPTIPTLNANTASERRSLTPSTTLTSTSSTTTSSSGGSSSNGAMRRAYTLSPTIKPLSHSTVISTAQRDSVYLKSPELKGMSAPGQPLSITTSSSNTSSSSSSVKLVKPMLLSPSDLAKLVV